MPVATKHDLLSARRVAVLGVTGSGKTTAARLIAAVIGAPAVDTDEDIRRADAAEHGPWSMRSEEERRQRSQALTAGPTWVVSDVAATTDALIEPRLDLVIYLDYPPTTTLRRLVLRTASRIVRHTPVCNGNTETLAEVLGPGSIIRWWASTWKERHLSAVRRTEAADGAPTLRLTDPRQLDLVLSALGDVRR